MNMPNCLGTYKKNDAVSLSSKYGELYLMAGNERWKNYDGIIVDGLLYLYEKSDEYSKFQFRVIEAVRKK
jgi:hypothetical protein